LSGLILNLKPYEHVLFGETVVQNGSRKAQLRVKNAAVGVLKQCDALHPAEVRSPLTRAYYLAQLLLLEGAEAKARPEEVAHALRETEVALGADPKLFEPVYKALAEGAFYLVLKALKPLLPQEAAILLHHEAGRRHAT
jgi:flagellar protein FlbT